MTLWRNNQFNKSGVVYIIRLHAQLLILAVAYFTAAGRLNIGRAWLYFGIVAVSYIVSSSILIKCNPELINERAKERENTKSWDKVLRSSPILSVNSPLANQLIYALIRFSILPVDFCLFFQTQYSFISK